MSNLQKTLVRTIENDIRTTENNIRTTNMVPELPKTELHLIEYIFGIFDIIGQTF